MEEDRGALAPGRLAIVQDLANSFDLRRGRDDLGSCPSAARWLVLHGLATTPGIDEPELEQLHELRAALRGLLLANNGQRVRSQDLDVVNSAIRRSRLLPQLTAAGTAELESRAEGFLFGIGQILAIVLEAIDRRTWERLKACPEDACNYAFYDHSRNRSRTWCAMARCGSRSKMRAYRDRRSRAGA